jgi:RNA polymerase primary sigma factor
MNDESFVIGIRHTAYHLALRRWRTELGYTQVQASDIVGIGLGTYQKIEALSQLPTPATLDKLVLATDLAPDVICPTWLRARFKGLVTSVDTTLELTPLSLNDPTNAPMLAAPDTTEHIEHEERQRALMEALEGLPERERACLILRFGLNGEKTHTLKEVADKFHITPERVRQIEAAAFRDIRHPRFSKKLREYMP